MIGTPDFLAEVEDFVRRHPHAKIGSERVPNAVEQDRVEGSGSEPGWSGCPVTQTDSSVDEHAEPSAWQFDRMANVPDNLSPGKRPCPFDKAGIELTKIGPKPPRDAWDVDPLRFHRLHPDGHELITRWIARAERAKSKEPFEAFIYAWIGFNGWATCTCDEDGDRAQLWIMELDPRLTQNFDDLMQESEFREAAQGFSSFWPIFRVSDLPEGVRRNRPKEGGRSAVTSYYQSECLTAKRAPDCHMRHTSIDWSHTLEALYQVRCNLFHGQKAGGGGNEDRTILLAAIGVLLPIAVSVLELY